MSISYSFVVTVIAIAATMVPLFTSSLENFVSKENPPIRYSMGTKTYQFSLVAGLAATFPIILELIVDAMMQLHNNIYASISRWTLMLSLFIPNIIILTALQYGNKFCVLPLVLIIRLILIALAFLTAMWAYGRPIWTSFRTSLLMTTFSLSCLFECLKTYYPHLSEFFYFLYLGFFLFSTVYFLFLAYLWIRNINMKRKCSIEITADDFCCKIHLFSACIFLVGVWVISSIYANEGWENASVENLTISSYWQVLYAALLTVWDTRIVRRQMAVLHATKELEMKRMFVKYVSHEIRTPLNTVMMGLKLLDRRLSTLQEPNLVDVVNDLTTSTDVAVNILNDLLTYEKLSSNVLQLEKSPVQLAPFLNETMHPFYLQADETGIRLNIVFESEVSSTSMQIDKSKISQVIRNLLSNALKFTKKDGEVDVVVSVVKSDTTKSRRRRSFVDMLGITSSRHSGSIPNNRSQNGNGVGPNNRSLHGITPPNHSQRVSSPNNHSQRVSSPNNEHRRSLFRRSFMRSQVEVDVESADHAHPFDHVEPCPNLVIKVTDTGPGISEENQKKLFKDIVQFNPAELQDGKGSGIGLWISYRIVELHGGSLSVFSAGEGHGTTFTLSLPIQNDENESNLNASGGGVGSVFGDISVSATSGRHGRIHPDPDSSARYLPTNITTVQTIGHVEDRPSSRSSLPVLKPFLVTALSNGHTFCGDSAPTPNTTMHNSDGRGSVFRESPRGLAAHPSSHPSHFKVLIVDDAAMNRKMLHRLIERDNFHISEACDGLEALHAVENSMKTSQAIDIVLMDYQMPNMDGPDAARKMRAAGYKGLIIGVTGNALESEIQHFMSKGANRVLTKPVNLEELEITISDHCSWPAVDSFTRNTAVTPVESFPSYPVESVRIKSNH